MGVEIVEDGGAGVNRRIVFIVVVALIAKMPVQN